MTIAEPTVANDNDEFWIGASQPSLDAVWETVEDDTYANVLTR